jgi:hypothetical protein
MAIVTIGGIPVYDAIISDAETGMYKISLVDDPAVMSNFLAFDNNRKVLMYQVEDNEKRLVRGVVMRADFPIYRYHPQMGEYYIIYKPEQIRIMAEKYLAEKRQNDVNVMHDSDVEGVQMVQYFIKGNGVSVEGFDDIADGSLFAEFHILNDEVWESVKEGSYRGFSLEGVFDLQPEEKEEFSNKHNKTTMSKVKRFMKTLEAAFLKEFAVFASMTTDKGVIAWEGEEDIKVGDEVYIEDAEGNRTPATDDTYKTEEGVTIIVTDGKVAEIIEPEAEVAPEETPEVAEEAAEETTEETPVEETPAEEKVMNTIATDKGELLYEGELAVGTEVFVNGEEGLVPAADEDYVLEDGRTLEVAESKVAKITDAPAEEVTEEPTEEAMAEETPETPVESEEVAALKAEIERLQEEIKELKKENKELKAAPMATAAHDEFTTSVKAQKTGDKGLDRLAKMMGNN